MAINDRITASGDEKNRSGFRSSAWQRQSEAWTITDDLFGDALHIRQQGRAYLPQFKKESTDKYEYRRGNSVMVNRFRETIETMSGTVFRSNPSPNDVSPVLTQMFSDVDLQGNSLHAFCIAAFEAYLKGGNCYIHVDAPAFNANGETRPTAADRIDDRPFWKLYEARQAINHQYAVINGRSVLSQITFEVESVEPDGEFGEKPVTKHIVMTRGAIREYVKAGDSDIFGLSKEIKTGLNFIPIVHCSEIGTPPPLIALALLNILHYNKTSDFDDWCHTACVPEKIYQYETKNDADAAKQEAAVASPGMGRLFWGANASVYFVEVKGQGLDIAKKRYEDIEAEMARIGVGMFAPSDASPRSATEVVDSAGRRESKLARYARSFENMIEKLLYMTGEVYNSIIPRTVDLSGQESSRLRLKIDYDRLTFSVDQMRMYADLVDGGKLSLRTFLELLSERTDLTPDFSVEDEMQRIGEENKIVIDNRTDSQAMLTA